MRVCDDWSATPRIGRKIFEFVTGTAGRLARRLKKYGGAEIPVCQIYAASRKTGPAVQRGLSVKAAERGLGGWALIQNFAPSCPEVVRVSGVN